ncbi:NAD(P)-dependent oxidoreductase [Eubacterium callanderi]|uniref:NAD(P)-dependent oxidoreductase n=1 Tax=Eubacterium callanderi TaxID=53442 RepID=UPI003AEF58B4
MKKIGFIGVGVMGKSMVRNLMKKGFDVSVYTRHKEKITDVLDEGAHWCDSVEACAKEKDCIITIVGYPTDVEEVYFGEKGIICNAASGCYLIDMTTTAPSQALRIYEAAKARGISSLDAPVSGGDSGARAGTLSIMVGGDKDAFEACMPVFEAMGTHIVYEGPAGFGHHTKMANQIALGGAIAGVCEAISYGRSVGLDVGRMLDSISKGAAGSWQMTNNGPKMLEEDFRPGFFVKHYVKDLRIASEESEAVHLKLSVLKDVLQMYETLQERGMGDLGTQALIRYYQDAQ